MKAEEICLSYEDCGGRFMGGTYPVRYGTAFPKDCWEADTGASRATVEIFWNTENLKSPVSIREIEFVFKNLPTKKSLGPVVFTSEFLQMLGKKITHVSENSSENKKMGWVETFQLIMRTT